MKIFPVPAILCLFFILLIIGACTEADKKTSKVDFETLRDSTDMTYSLSGFSEPEAVRYDPELDLYFISNFNGGGNDRDSNGFISSIDAGSGNIRDLKYITAKGDNPLHAPRGMFITGDSLWVADVDGVHAFNKKTGEQLAFIDFRDLEPGFLNDISADSSGTLYITDTGKARVYRIRNETPSLFLDSLSVNPNGIVLDPVTSYFILAPWGGKTVLHAFRDNQNTLKFGELNGGNFDGLEFAGLNLLVTSQMDSSVRVFDGISNWKLIQTPGRGADLGYDTKRHMVLVPYIARNRVDVWSLKK